MNNNCAVNWELPTVVTKRLGIHTIHLKKYGELLLCVALENISIPHSMKTGSTRNEATNPAQH